VVVVLLVAVLTGCGAPVARSTTVEPSRVAAAEAGSTRVRVLQLNLCNSGIAGCYTGRSIAEAATVIRAEEPDLVTLNEICEDDVAIIERALAGGAGTSAFQAARDARTGGPYRCRNGRPYGIGVVSRWPAVPGSTPARGIHPTQDREDPEERPWLCLDVAATRTAAPAVAACTTHLAYTDRGVAVAQCRYMVGTVVAGVHGRGGTTPVVLGGDLNLGRTDSPDLRSCLPPASRSVDDGGQQHVVATPEFAVAGSRTVELRGTTDHPALLVDLTLPATAGPAR
jgi:endonuclease/exonuclease/phosphatase family metal-dependent hydrolase